MKWNSKAIADWFYLTGLEPIVVGSILLAIIAGSAATADPYFFSLTWKSLYFFAPFILPFLLGKLLWIMWMRYIRFQHWLSRNFVLLKIELPPEVAKSPRAMEIFMAQLYNTGGETTILNRCLRGQFRPIWTLEIASDEGRISYYIHLHRDWQAMLEGRLYGQFPEARITEAEDYVVALGYNEREFGLHGSEYQYRRSMAYPMRTYIDFGLDADPKEEVKTDPITNILELLGSMGTGEHMWFQLVLKAHSADQWYGFDKWGAAKDQFGNALNAQLKAFVGNASKRAESLIAGGDAKAEERKAQAAARGFTLLTEGERRQVEAMERKRSKLLFEVGVRTIYVARHENFRGVNIASLVRFFDTFRSNDLNSLSVTRGLMNMNYPWQDVADIRHRIERSYLYRTYRDRGYFFAPYEQIPVIMSVEEVATLWHFPGSVVETPGLERVAARRAEAPPNLPV